MRFVLSVVIPAYNAEKVILPLFQSLCSSEKIDWSKIEVVVVDDHSEDETLKKILSAPTIFPKLQNFKIISLKKRSGPAAARNIGAKYACGKVLLFLDADVLVYRKTLYEVVRCFKIDKDLFALTGVWDKKQKSKKFFPQFKALRDWSYWINERDPKNYYYLFSTRVAAIRRDLFLRLGGFDTTYKTALIEDIELTYRIARRYAVVFNPKVIVHHEFEDFWPVAKKYFWRSFYWSKIYRKRKKFDPVATTLKEALTTFSATASLFFFFLSLVFSLFGIKGGKESFFFALLFFLVHLLGVGKFILFCRKEKGWWFALKAFFTGYLLYLVILAGAFFSFWDDFFAGKRKISS